MQGILRLVFVVDVQLGQLAPGLDEGPELRREGDVRQVTFEVGGVGLAVGGVMQDGVDVVEDVPFGNGGILVMLTELR